ncbi:MAG: DedA family protein [Thermoplasmata archaeon]|nr:DedA family protein [Thermoplasmata archaeon]
MTLESTMLPIPSEIVIPFSAYLAFKGILNIYLVIIISSLGGLAGSLIAYYIGYFGGRAFILKYGKYLFISEKNLTNAEKWFYKYGKISVFLTRLVPVIRTFISLPAGIGKMPIKEFIFYTFTGTFIWSIILALGGYMLGNSWIIIFNIFSNLDPLIIAIGIIVLIYIFIELYKNYKNNYK